MIEVAITAYIPLFGKREAWGQTLMPSADYNFRSNTVRAIRAYRIDRGTHKVLVGGHRLSSRDRCTRLSGSEGRLDFAIRFGDGAWHGIHAEPILEAPLSPLCSPAVAARLTDPSRLARETLFRSYRADEWPRWFDAAGTPCPSLRGPVFDSSLAMVATAYTGAGVALAPALMFSHDLTAGRLVQPFPANITTGIYWLTRLMSRKDTPAMAAFRSWLQSEADG